MIYFKQLSYLPDPSSCDINEWEAQMKMAIEEHPADAASIYFRLANYLFATNGKQRYPEVIDYYRNAAELATTDEQKSQGYHWLAYCYRCYKKEEEAQMLEYLYKSLEYNSSYSPALEDLGKHYTKKKKYRKALAYYEALSTVKGYEENVWSNIGTLHLQLKEYDQAIAAYKTSLLIKEQAHDYANMGRAYMWKGEMDTALLHLKKAVELNPKSPYILFFAGLAYQKNEDYYRAIHYYQQVIKLKPTHLYAHTNMATCKQETEGERAAIDYLTGILQLDLQLESKENIYMKLAALFGDIKDFESEEFLITLIAMLRYQRGDLNMDDFKDFLDGDDK